MVESGTWREVAPTFGVRQKLIDETSQINDSPHHAFAVVVPSATTTTTTTTTTMHVENEHS